MCVFVCVLMVGDALDTSRQSIHPWMDASLRPWIGTAQMPDTSIHSAAPTRCAFFSVFRVGAMAKSSQPIDHPATLRVICSDPLFQTAAAMEHQGMDEDNEEEDSNERNKGAVVAAALGALFASLAPHKEPLTTHLRRKV